MLAVGDAIQIRSIGTGLKLLDHPDVIPHKLSPRLLDTLDLGVDADGTLEVPVVAEIPSHLMGSGAELMADYVDQDFMSGDRAQIAELGLDQLRLGDIVAVRDEDHGWGRGFHPGAVTIGLIIHGDSAWTGHGPGVLDLLSSRSGAIVPPRARPEHRPRARASHRRRACHPPARRPRQLLRHPRLIRRNHMSDNRSQLVGVAVQGSIASPQCPALPASPYIIGADGTPVLLPPPGGIVYNVAVGDSAFGWVADMVQPGVSIAAGAGANPALRGLACIGNEAIVVTGRARGERGTVTGKSGRFAEHVIVHFEPSVLESMALGDQVLVRALGRGLALSDAAEVQLKSISPRCLTRWRWRSTSPTSSSCRWSPTCRRS